MMKRDCNAFNQLLKHFFRCFVGKAATFNCFITFNCTIVHDIILILQGVVYYLKAIFFKGHRSFELKMLQFFYFSKLPLYPQSDRLFPLANTHLPQKSTYKTCLGFEYLYRITKVLTQRIRIMTLV